jgi:hypothetical protein
MDKQPQMDEQQGKAAGRQPRIVPTEASPTGITQRNPRVSGTNLRFTGVTTGITI